MGRTFQYQALTRNFAAIPAPSPQTIEWTSQPEIPVKVGKRQPWTDNCITFTAAAVPPLDIEPIYRHRSQLIMMPTRKKFQVEHIQVQSGGDIFPTMPMPQRAYTCIDLPPVLIRRFFAAHAPHETGWPVYTVPMQTRSVGGAEPLPMTFRKVGACHYPAHEFVPPAVLPVPTQTYSPNELPSYSRQKKRDYLGEFPGSSPWFQTTLFHAATFSDQAIPQPVKRKPYIPESSIFLRDFTAPAYGWQLLSEPLPKVQTRNAITEMDFAGDPVKLPWINWNDAMPPAPVRSRNKNVLDVTQTTTIRTTNEVTYPGSWVFDPHIPAPTPSSYVWLIPVISREPRIGPVDGGDDGGSVGDACPIELTGYDNTIVELVGYDLTSGTYNTAELTGYDNTTVNLTGEC